MSPYKVHTEHMKIVIAFTVSLLLGVLIMLLLDRLGVNIKFPRGAMWLWVLQLSVVQTALTIWVIREILK